MTNPNSTELTAPEISLLWDFYQSDTLAICGIKHFLHHVEDEQIKETLVTTYTSLQERVQKLTNIFKEEGYPLPQGFTEQDVNETAPRLFSDKLYLEYILNMSNISLSMYSMAVGLSERKDLIDYFSTNLINSLQLYNQTKELEKEKGFYLSMPNIPKPKQVDFVKKQSFLAGWFGDRRPMLGMEISELNYNLRRNALGQAIITGFSQVAQSKELRRYFERGRDIAKKHVEIFSSILNNEFLPSGGLILTSEVTDSTVAPYSDKFMMALVQSLSSSGIGQYGTSISVSPRRDLGALYTRLMAEIATFSDDGANIMIDHGWMEQPPMAANRKELAE